MDLRKIALGLAGTLLACALWLAWLWQPERQVRLHQQHFLKAAEDRDWNRLSDFLGEEYRDDWDHDKAIVLGRMREVLGQFIFLEIAMEEMDCTVDGDTGRAEGRMQISGRGGPLAEFVVVKANAIERPWRFHWRKGARPWDWRLIRVEQPDLEIPEL